MNKQTIGALADEAMQQAISHVRTRLGVVDDYVVREFVQTAQYQDMVRLMAAYVLAEGIRQSMQSKKPLGGVLVDAPAVH